jgi:hypothetical protein
MLVMHMMKNVDHQFKENNSFNFIVMRGINTNNKENNLGKMFNIVYLHQVDLKSKERNDRILIINFSCVNNLII